MAFRDEEFHAARVVEIEEIEARAAEADATADQLPDGRDKTKLRAIALYCRTIADIHRQNLDATTRALRRSHRMCGATSAQQGLELGS